MDEQKTLYIRLGVQLVSMIALVVALFGMVKGNQLLITWGIIVASLINGGTTLAQYRATRKLSQLILALVLFGLCAVFVASLFIA